MRHKQEELDEIYIRLFVIVPLLFYTGYFIMRERSHTSTMLFHAIVIFTIALLLFYHLRYIIKHLRRIFMNQKYQKEFGVFLLFLAVFLFIIGARDLYLIKKT